MLAPIFAGALAIGPFSGVSLDTLTDTPMLVQEVLFQVAGEQLLGHGEGMALEERDGQQVVVTQQGFSVEIARELQAGRYGVQVEATAPDKGTDSYWLVVDGKQGDQPLQVPVNAMGKRSSAATVENDGRHTLRLVLREKPGSVLRSVALFRLATKLPAPPMRQELVGKHPRLFFTAADVESLRRRLSDERVQRFYKLADTLAKKPPAFKPGQRNGGSYRSLGSYAFSHLMEPADAKLTPILDWLEMATTYPHCGADLDAEYFTEGVALTYDWLHDQIPADLRTRVRDTLARQCREVYERSLTGSTGGGLSFQQNHYWYAHLALALGAAAIVGEVPEAETWLAWAWDRFERIALTFSPDGGFHEGPGYWDFSMPTLYMYTDLYEWCTGLRIPAGDDGLRGQAEFRFHHLYPGLKSTAALEDTTPGHGRPARSLLLWEAKRFKEPLAMGMAELLSPGPETTCWNLLWLDETVKGSAPTETLPLGRYYPDIETAFARTAWTDDATSVAFVSRPLGGHKWADLCAKFSLGGTGHNHPEQNHFVLFGRGEVLAVDPGYTYEKRTRNHNTVLVDGQGQYGDGQMWPGPTPGRSRITQCVTKGDVTIVTGDASSAYPRELGLTRFERTLVLAGRDIVVVCDRLAAEQPRTFSWLLHHYGKTAGEGSARTITRGTATLRVAPLLPSQVAVEETTYRPVYVHPTRDHTPKEADVNLLELKTGQVTETTFLVPLLVGDAGSTPPALANVSNETCDAVRVGDTVVAFRRGEGKVSVEAPWGGKLESAATAVVARVRDGKREVVEASANQ
jgi:hypothetical protein